MIKTIEDLDFELILLRRKREAVRKLFNEGKVSKNTLNLLEEKICNIETAITNLKEIIDGEKKFWESVIPEETRILESLLVDFRFLNLIGEIGSEKWRDLSETIISGLNAPNGESINSVSEPAESIDKACVEGDHAFSIDVKPPVSPRKSFNAVNRRRNSANDRRSRNGFSSPHGIEKPGSHCMNPWKPECRRADIKLSIYYNGQMLPICYECWKEISKKNIEWTT